jgi:hypothetical protein
MDLSEKKSKEERREINTGWKEVLTKRSKLDGI